LKKQEKFLNEEEIDEQGIEAILLDKAHYLLDYFGFFGYIHNTVCQTVF
jgi:hypothetical protein